jgi:hypothetical protein
MSQEAPDFDGSDPAGDGEGQSSTRVGELDMRNVGDRSKLAEAIRRNWPIIASRIPRYLAACDAVIRETDPSDPAGARAIAQCTAVVANLHGQAVRDLHHVEKMAHVAEGGVTARVEIVKPAADHDALRERLLASHRPTPN